MKLLRKLCAEQVNILLDRMESHPEEFYKVLQIARPMYESKWDMVLSAGEFNRIEKFLIKRKMKELKREATHRQILMTIMYGKDEDLGETYKFSTAGRFSQTEHDRKMVVSKSMVEHIKAFQKELNK